jgi:hypothetical protein
MERQYNNAADIKEARNDQEEAAEAIAAVL